jgi:hypothetical protein
MFLHFIQTSNQGYKKDQVLINFDFHSWIYNETWLNLMVDECECGNNKKMICFCIVIDIS